MAQRSRSVPVGHKATKTQSMRFLSELQGVEDKARPTMSPLKSPKTQDLKEAVEVTVSIYKANGDLLREEVILDSKPLTEVAMPWLLTCSVLGGDYQQVSPTCLVEEVAKGESTVTITVIENPDEGELCVDKAWKDYQYVEFILDQYLHLVPDVRHVARALVMLTEIDAFFNEEGGKFALKCLTKLKSFCQEGDAVPAGFLLLRPFLQEMRRCFKCSKVASHADHSCTVNGYTMEWTCRRIQCWKRACFVQRGKGSAFQQMKVILEDLAEKVMADGPECDGAARDRYNATERARFLVRQNQARIQHDALTLVALMGGYGPGN